MSEATTVLLGSVATFGKGSGLPKSDIKPGGDLPCVHYGELFTHYGAVIREVRSHTDGVSHPTLSRRGDVLMPTSDVTPRGLAKASAIDLQGVVLGGDILIIRPDQSILDSQYLAHAIRHDADQVLSLVRGSTVYHLYATDMRNYSLRLPPLAEQRQIAGALLAADELVESLESLIAKKEHIRQGVMHQLLSGENRLPGFSEPWISGPLRRFMPLQRGFDLPTTEVRPGHFPVVYSNGISRYHDTARVSGPGVVTGRSGTIGKVHFVAGDYWPHNTSLWVTSFASTYPRFVYYYLTHLGLERFSSGSGVPTLNRNDAHSFVIRIPSDMDEQRSIASVLSAVDDELNHLHVRLRKSLAIKRGMMQELLSGRTRLEVAEGAA